MGGVSSHGGNLRIGNKSCNFRTYKKTDNKGNKHQKWEIDCPGSDYVNELKTKEERVKKVKDVKVEHLQGKTHLTLDTKNLVRKFDDETGWSVLDPTDCNAYQEEEKCFFPLDFGARKKLEVRQEDGVLNIFAQEEGDSSDED